MSVEDCRTAEALEHFAAELSLRPGEISARRASTRREGHVIDLENQPLSNNVALNKRRQAHFCRQALTHFFLDRATR
jgi:hypothetical protein